MSNKKPLVSVIIPSYNHSRFVQESIKSIINQDYEEIELIVIDDGSKDDSVAKIQEMIHECRERFSRFEFIHRENKGLCATLNEALVWSEGHFFSPLASDDVALPHKISFLVDKIEKDKGDVVFGRVIDGGNKKFPNKNNNIRKIHKFHELLIQKNIPPAPASLMRKKIVEGIGGFDISTKLEDWDMWLRLADEGRALISYQEPVVFYRRHDFNITNNAQLIVDERAKIINKYRERPQYNMAIRYADLQAARDFSESSKHQALVYFLRARILNGLSILIFAKIFLPKAILSKIRIYFNG